MAIPHLENGALEDLHHDHPTILEGWDSFVMLVDDAQMICIAYGYRLYTILPGEYVTYLLQGSLVALFSILR
jgi:hypothetical protein